ncbi:MAG: hypothetical protein HYV96_05025 [Opitutae bacterium]|nr:hypothetical protein [Opitutae bacterium]
MPSVSGKRFLLATSALLVLATLATVSVRRSLARPAAAPSPRPAASRVAPPDTRRTPASPETVAAAGPSPLTPASLATATQRVVTLPFATAFPNAPERRGDWRSFQPESLTVAPHADLPVTFTRVAMKQEGPYTTWLGRNSAIPGASLVAVATATGYDAILVLPGSSQFSFHVRGSEVVVAEAAPGEEGCSVAPAQADRPAAIAAAPSLLEVVTDAATAPKADTVTTTVTTLVPATVDVLFAYDADTLAAATTVASSDPVGYIDRQCKAMIESSNLALAQSDVSTFTWRHLGVVAAPAYTRDGTSLRDVQALTDPAMLRDWVLETRYRRGADQVMLLVAGKMDFGGRAYSQVQTPVVREYAVAVMRWGNSFKTLAHELAHNFGCQHDRAHLNVNAPGDYGPAAPDSDGVYAYGQMWQNGPLPPGSVGTSGTGGTIMSYADWVVPYYSNPGISLRVGGAMFGWSWNPDLGTHQLGLAETDPKAAYNARVLRESGPLMAAIEDEITAPTITAQPRNVTVVRGESFLLTVAASGGGLFFQWRKGGVDIPGATTATFSKIADSSEPESYSVKVSNFAGAVVSDAVAITVTTPPPPPSAGGSSSGGGGGGSPSSWFFGAVVSLALLRHLGSRRSHRR